MKMTDVHRYARELKEAHGSKALAEAAQRAVDFEKQGERRASEELATCRSSARRDAGSASELTCHHRGAVNRGILPEL
jgi:hypothetical protein